MTASPRETVLCRYHYDPLDRLVDCMLFEQAGIQRFYCKSRLATEIQGAMRCSIFQHDDQLLAQQQHGTTVDTTLLATDQQRSVLKALDTSQRHPLAYTPYGHRPPENGLLSLLGFNGERPDPLTGHYHLGNGYRQLNPVLMRFNSPDSWSPFGEGGLNAYAYCLGDPINLNDRTGHTPGFLKTILRGLGLMKKSSKTVHRAGTTAQTMGESMGQTSASAATSGNHASRTSGLPSTQQPSNFDMSVLESDGFIDAQKNRYEQLTNPSQMPHKKKAFPPLPSRQATAASPQGTGSSSALAPINTPKNIDALSVYLDYVIESAPRSNLEQLLVFSRIADAPGPSRLFAKQNHAIDVVGHYIRRTTGN